MRPVIPEVPAAPLVRREPSNNGWTIGTLKEYLESNLAANKEALSLLAAANQRAQDKAQDAAEKAQDKFEQDVFQRFVAVNEFRRALDDLGKTMATRRELETMQESYRSQSAAVQETARAQYNELSKSLQELRSRVDVGPTGLTALQSRSDTQTGRQQGVQLTTSTLVTVITIAAAFVGILAYLAGHH